MYNYIAKDERKTLKSELCAIFWRQRSRLNEARVGKESIRWNITACSDRNRQAKQKREAERSVLGGRMKEEWAEGKLIKGHQREMNWGREGMKECRPFVPCRSRSAPPEPALRSQGHCAARVHGGGWGTTHTIYTQTHTQTHTNKCLRANFRCLMFPSHSGSSSSRFSPVSHPLHTWACSCFVPPKSKHLHKLCPPHKHTFAHSLNTYCMLLSVWTLPSALACGGSGRRSLIMPR